MLIAKLDNLIIQSGKPCFTVQVFGTALPCGLFGKFGHPINGVHVVLTVN